MDMNNENRINEVMNSLDKIQQAEANPFLYNRIMNKITAANADYTPARLVWLAVASFLLLLLLNFTAVKRTLTGSATEKTELSEVVSGYNLINDNSINYN